MAKLGYTTILSQFKKGDNSPCYTAHIKHNGTVSSDDFIKRLAEQSARPRADAARCKRRVRKRRCLRSTPLAYPPS